MCSSDLYFTEGSDALLEARRDIARFSLPRAAHRIRFQKAESTIPLRLHVKHRKAIHDRVTGFDLFGSQIASERPVSGLRCSPNGEMIAVGTWGGNVKLLDIPNLENVSVLRGHTEIVSGLAWIPGATLPDSGISKGMVNLATGGGEGNIHLWSLDQDTPLSTLSGHESRVAKVEFHPSCKYLASASYDGTWRLWDINTTTELLMQEGHSREVHTVAMNEDGSLIASAGLDGIGRVWDLRTGGVIMYLDSHMDSIYALDWGVDGYRLLSGSGDGFIKCWDLRKVQEVASIGAHTGGVTDLRWFKGNDGPAMGKMPPRKQPTTNQHMDVDGADPNGHSEDQNQDQSHDKSDGDDDIKAQSWLPKKAGTLIVSAGFDKSVKVFSADDWALHKTLSAHAGNVTAVDITSDGRWIASCGRDRSVKLWSPEDMEAL